MHKELEDLLDMLDEIGQVCDRFDDPDRALVLRLRKQVQLLTRDEIDVIRNAAKARGAAYLGWLEVGVAKD
ncbi:MAG: hypothetical protein EOP10_21710 [Proteobacteria bacterium]|nr:MAG: hypothetical protein EOP10_21710 [Pseudomonadota bacterium]